MICQKKQNKTTITYSIWKDGISVFFFFCIFAWWIPQTFINHQNCYLTNNILLINWQIISALNEPYVLAFKYVALQNFQCVAGEHHYPIMQHAQQRGRCSQNYKKCANIDRWEYGATVPIKSQRNEVKETLILNCQYSLARLDWYLYLFLLPRHKLLTSAQNSWNINSWSQWL